MELKVIDGDLKLRDFGLVMISLNIPQLNNRNFFLTVLDAESPRSRCQQV